MVYLCHGPTLTSPSVGTVASSFTEGDPGCQGGGVCVSVPLKCPLSLALIEK